MKTTSRGCLFFLVILLSAVFQRTARHGCLQIASAKEIEATDEWQLLREGDTIPAGLHVRMDLSTGEKWVKKISQDGEPDDANRAMDIEIGPDGEPIPVSTASSSALVSLLSPDEVEQQTQEEITRKIYQYDYMAMYRALSKLPPEELQRLGGLPPLPTTGSIPEKEAFESKMGTIWEIRQEELARLQEEVELADLPELLKNYIRTLKSFLRQRYIACYGTSHEFIGNGSATIADELFPVDLTDVQFVLSELEYHLADIDMARDFHTLGGWPVLGFLLDPPLWLWESGCDGGPHEQQNTTSATENETSVIVVIREEREKLQTAAAWAIGNAVKNHGEFALWPLEPVPTTLVALLDQRKAAASPMLGRTMISLLLDLFQKQQPDSLLDAAPSSSTLTQKALYALGSILRGNRYAQVYCLDMGGGLILGNYLQNSLHAKNYKLVAKVLSLAHDIITEVSNEELEILLKSKDLPIETIQEHGKLIHEFTGEQWCWPAYKLLEESYIDSMKGIHQSAESALRLVEPMIPYCRDAFSEGDTRKLTDGLKSEWKRDSKLDDEWRQELLDLAHSVESRLRVS